MRVLGLRRFGILALSLGLLGLLTSAVVPATATETDPRAVARATGKPVLMPSETTETTQQFANPDGSYTLEMSAVPVRVRKKDAWVPVDYDLVQGTDGVLRPKAAPGDIELSNGGSGAVSTITIEGVRTAVTFPEVLPVPTVDGPSATYANVYPGVDLRMTANAAGVAQTLIVKNAEAAANPALDRIALTMDVDGGSIRQIEGRLSVVDDAGREVGVGVPPSMWDSSGVVEDDAGRAVADASSLAMKRRSEAPIDGDKTGAVGMSTVGDKVTLSPDVAKIGGAGASYPIYVDPVITTSRVKWAMVSKASPDQAYYKWANVDYAGNYGQGVGYQYWNGNSTVKRLYWSFDTTKLFGATVSAATFVARVVSGATCDRPFVALYRTNEIFSTTTWNRQPSWGNVSTPNYQTTDDYFVSEARPDSCTSAGVPIQRDVEWDAKSAMQIAADRQYLNATLGLRSYSETDPTDWKRFTYNAYIRVTYSKPPAKPTSLKVNGLACSDTPILMGTQTVGPQLEAELSDPDSGAMVSGTFHYNSVPAASPAPAALTTPAQATGAVHKTVRERFIAPTDPDTGALLDGTWTWTVQGKDSSASHLVGPSSDSCTFTIDSTQPSTPAIAVDGDWQAGQPTPVTFTPGGDPADTASYVWTLNSATPDPLNVVVASGTGHTASVTVPGASVRAGVNTLRVWSVDAAGNRSATAKQLVVDAGGLATSKTSTYTFNGETGADVYGDTSALDSGVNPDTANPTPKDLNGVLGHWLKRGEYRINATVNGIDNMMAFDGTAGVAPSATGDVVELRNDQAGSAPNQSFTVSAWLNPTGTLAGEQTALSYGTDAQSAVKLGVSPNPSEGGSPYYYVSVWNTAGVSPGYETLWSQVPARLDDGDHALGLTHVVAWYDSEANALHLVVAGSQSDADDTNEDETDQYHASSRVLATGFLLPESTADNRLTIGANHNGGVELNRWNGWIDHVAIGQGAGSASVVTRLHAQNYRFAWVCEYEAAC